MNQTLIEMKNISMTFPGVKALDRVSFSIRAGEIHGLAGENGAGKSTLIKILTGVYRPDAGAEIFANGQRIKINNPMDAVAAGISVIYQDFSLFANMTVSENIMFNYNRFTRKRFVNWISMRKKAQEVLDDVGIDVLSDEIVENLSVGKQQLVAIAKALVFDSKLLIMDEPTSTLSNAEVQQLFSLMARLKSRGVSMLFVTHKLDEMFSVADSITVLRDGRCVGTNDVKELNQQTLISKMVGREVTTVRKTSCRFDEVVLSVKGISKTSNYHDISFDLHRGEILGISGLVGSGRSEVLLTLFGMNRPDSGEIWVHGNKVSIQSPATAKKLGIALLPENRLTEGAFLDKTVKENISSASLEMFKGRNGLIDVKKENIQTDQYARMLDVRPHNMNLNVRNLSGGNQQKVVIAKWLLSAPDIFIVDEPTNGIDVGAKTEIHKLLIQLAEQGKSIIVVSSEMLEIIALADNVLVMSHGCISGRLSGDEITQESMMQSALGK